MLNKIFTEVLNQKSESLDTTKKLTGIKVQNFVFEALKKESDKTGKGTKGLETFL